MASDIKYIYEGEQFGCKDMCGCVYACTDEKTEEMYMALWKQLLKM